MLTVISRHNHALLQSCCGVNVTIAMTALLIAQFVHGLAIYNLMGLACHWSTLGQSEEKFSIVHVVCSVCIDVYTEIR